MDMTRADEGRILVVLNERVAGEERDWYSALRRLQSEGAIAAWRVVPYLGVREAIGDDVRLVEEIVKHAQDIRATVVLWVHFHGIEVPSPAIGALRGIGEGATLGYWDGDWYDPYRNPFPATTRRLCARCDTVFVCGDGYLVRLLKRAGCSDVRYVASSGDERFVKQMPRVEYEFDVAMIGSRVSSRLPFRTMPGNAVRRRLVDAFSARFGRRFAIFGPGWEGPSAMGPIPFDQQGEVYGRSMVALGNNNWFTPYYFSNRLPIAMQCGRPLVHCWGEGYDEVFGRDPGVRWFRDVEGAVKRVEEILNSPEAAIADAERARLVAEKRFTTHHALRYMIRVLVSRRQNPARMEGGEVANPWMARERL